MSLTKNAKKKKIIHTKQIETKRTITFKDYWNEIIKALIVTKLALAILLILSIIPYHQFNTF